MSTPGEQLQNAGPADQHYAALYESLQAEHQVFYASLINLDKILNPIPPSATMRELDEQIMVDVGFLFREAENLLDDWRKELKARRMKIERALGLAAARRAAETMDPDGLKLSGNLATGTPSPKKRAVLPKAGTPEYAALLRHFGIDPEIVEAGIFQLHWMRFSDLITRQQEQGLPMPPGVRESFTEYQVIFRRRRGKNKE